MTVSLGVIETTGLTAAIQAADAACKSAGVNLACYKKIGSGLVSIYLLGEISAIKAATDSGYSAIKDKLPQSTFLVLARPDDAVLEMIKETSSEICSETQNNQINEQQEPASIENDSEDSETSITDTTSASDTSESLNTTEGSETLTGSEEKTEGEPEPEHANPPAPPEKITDSPDTSTEDDKHEQAGIKSKKIESTTDKPDQGKPPQKTATKGTSKTRGKK
ncbi:BMC domain-containing protein [Photobacterium leiognathi]|uniref:BMC domain-containing protein n=1 Tax=Photobacterium leiognathi TaxID=553611 RepID=UPI001EDEB09C|nr:BMC domain-containing protein [Photobacterium leiognathi]MCG3884845.1 BMC domain-containing protein [Photobacterium leiognathi]